MGISIHLKIIAIFLVASLCLNNFAVLGQQNRGCGREYDSSDYVASTSSQVQIHEHPWMVAIVKKIEPDVAHCSASLVAPKFIITAGHCFNDKPKEAFEVVLGSDYLSQLPFNIQTYQKRMNIAKLHIHPNYIKEGKYHDFAIIELNEEVTYSKGIFPICLPQTETTPEHILSLSGDFVDLVGFGKTGLNDGKKNQKLRFASIKIYSQLHCNTVYQKEINEANVFNSSILCAGSRIKGIGSCGGDSGGPLMKFIDSGEYFEQIALTKGYGNCGIYPGMYTRIGDPTNFRWMQSVIFGKTTAEEVGTKILIATGSPSAGGRNTEVIDLEDSNFSCTKVEQFPIRLLGATGGLMNGQKPFICGGRGKINGDWTYSKDCYQLTEAGSWAKDQTAKLNAGRRWAGYGSVVIDNNLFLAGGTNGNRLTSIEMLSPDATSQTMSVKLPTGLSHHCQVPWDSDKYFIIGGSDGSRRDETHFINVKTNQLTNGPSLNTARSGHACGEMDVNGKSYIIVTGGVCWNGDGLRVDLRSTEVLDKNNVEQGWQKGDDFDLPVSKRYFQMVSSPDKKTLYAIGGNDSGSKKDIYKSDCNSDIKSCKWIKSNTELKYGRADFVAIPIPNSLADKLCK